MMTFKIKYHDDFQTCVRGKIADIPTRGYNTLEKVLFIAGKVQYAAWFLVAPFLLSAHSAAHTLGLILTAEMAMAWVLAFMFQLAHVVDGVTMLRD